MSIIKHTYPQLTCLGFPNDDKDADGSQVKVSVGLDAYWEVVSGRFVIIRRGIVALETVFGYVMSNLVDTNPENKPSGSKTSYYVDVSCKASPTIAGTLHKFWFLGFLGIMSKETTEGNFSGDLTFKIANTR